MKKATRKDGIVKLARNIQIFRHHKQGFSLSILSSFYNLDESVISRIIKEQQLLSQSRKAKKPQA
jgi:hypothetical protein